MRSSPGALPSGVEVDGPALAADLEGLGRDELADADALGEGVAGYGKLVGAVARRVHRRRRASGSRRRRRRPAIHAGVGFE